MNWQSAARGVPSIVPAVPAAWVLCISSRICSRSGPAARVLWISSRSSNRSRTFRVYANAGWLRHVTPAEAGVQKACHPGGSRGPEGMSPRRKPGSRRHVTPAEAGVHKARHPDGSRGPQGMSPRRKPGSTRHVSPAEAGVQCERTRSRTPLRFLDAGLSRHDSLTYRHWG